MANDTTEAGHYTAIMRGGGRWNSIDGFLSTTI
jgi:hypothetical protein